MDYTFDRDLIPIINFTLLYLYIMKEFRKFIYGVIWLFILTVFWLLTFCSAENYSNTVQSITLSVNSGYNYDWFMCIWPTNSNCGKYTQIYINWLQVSWFPNWQNHQRLWCWNWNINFVNWHTQWYDCTYNVYTFLGFDLNCPVCGECETCPEVDTGAILSGYIAIDDITDNYCISNWLCGEISTWLSTLYINDIRHESRPFLYVNIPEEFDWEYTWNAYQLYVDVKGYNTDSDYISSVISSQISKPTSEDFWNLINVVAKFVPWLVIILFIYFIFRFIKKIF